ncbi:secondary thiamine-phosphate synthase enzyme YjbQ [Hansschlegelia sp.]|uniref:secondary thiamine-phosphate synthase enzyme YjbQ n=1 Tax=Hansschlegelia sp. TaxID=2041892 RepID=UPI0039C879A5
MFALMKLAADTATVDEIRVGVATHQAIARLTVRTRGAGLSDVTSAVAAALEQAGAGDGLATVFLRHTSCSLTIQENASPEVRDDLVDALDRLAPRDAGWRHDLEGPDDMPAHVKAMLTGVSLAIPVIAGRLALGVWQAIFLIEHRDRPHRREFVVHFVGSRV